MVVTILLPTFFGWMKYFTEKVGARIFFTAAGGNRPVKTNDFAESPIEFLFLSQKSTILFFFLVRRDVNRLEYLLQFLRKRFSIAILDPVLSQRGGNRHEWTDIFLSFFFFVRNGSRLSLSLEK